MHDDVRVRRKTVENLTRLAEMDSASFRIAWRLARNATLVPARFVDYMYQIQNRPTACLLCEILFETRGRYSDAPSEDAALDAAVHITAHAALIKRHPGFSRLFWKIVRDDTYNYVVKHLIALRCREFRADDILSTKTIIVYSELLDSHDPLVWDDAGFFLLSESVLNNRSCLPQIAPALEKLSGMDYGGCHNMTVAELVEYLAKFWKENPEKFAAYLARLCNKNLEMVIYDEHTPLVLDVMQAMLQSCLPDGDAMQRLCETLARFKTAGCSRAGEILRAESALCV